MKNFKVKPKESVLVGFKVLLKEIPELTVGYWAFKRMELVYPLPFGLPVQEFERLTDELASGFIVSNNDFMKFIQVDDFQILDGQISGYSSNDMTSPMISFECVDSSLWSIDVFDPSLIAKLEQADFAH